MLDRLEIKNGAKQKWDTKTPELRVRSGNKYKFIVEKFHKKIKDWSLDFDDLSNFQKKILIKGELIRTYDSLPNSEKTKIKNELNLSKFSYKWYKLSSSDKKILLNYVIG